MTKRKAQDIVGTNRLTFGHLKHYLEIVLGHSDDAPSVVNQSLTRHQGCRILLAGIAHQDDADMVVSDRYSERKNAMHSLAAVNVIRETHFYGSPVDNSPQLIVLTPKTEKNDIH